MGEPEQTGGAAGVAAYPGGGGEGPLRYRTNVRVRWSDLDAFGHVNNARTLTLLEEARVDWLFLDAAEHGAGRLSEGVVVSELSIRYRRPIEFRQSVEVSMGLTELRAVSMTIDYLVHADSHLAVTASSQLVPIDLGSGRPRRWDDDEFTFLARYLAP